MANARHVAALDRLGQALTAAELALFEVNPGVQAFVTLPGFDDEPELHWGKQGGKWCLYVVRGDSGFESVQQVLQCSVAVRLAAAHALPVLMDVIRDSQDAEAQRINAATEAAQKFAAELRERNGGI